MVHMQVNWIRRWERQGILAGTTAQNRANGFKDAIWIKVYIIYLIGRYVGVRPERSLRLNRTAKAAFWPGYF